MIIQVRVNNNDNLIYKLCEWNSTAFASSPVLRLQTSDLTGVKNAFSEIEKIEIFQANTLIAEYTLYDTYSSISYLGQVYVQHENIFADCLEIQLNRSSLVDQVKRIEEAISDNIDIDAMSIEEYRNFVLQQVSKDCTADIENGMLIEIDETNQNFSFKAEDQINLLQLYLMTKMFPEVTALPYHSNGHTCMFYTAEQIQTIYISLITRLLTLTTYANQLNLYIKTMTTKEELVNVRYGMELPESYARVVSDIVSQMVSILGNLTTENNEENVEPVEEGNTNETENNMAN